MKPGQFNGTFRPLVDRAWDAQCEITGHDPKDRMAKDAWYREQLATVTTNHQRTTKGLDNKEQLTLIKWFDRMAPKEGAVHGWTDLQNHYFKKLAAKAWMSFEPDPNLTYETWLEGILDQCDVHMFKGRRTGTKREDYDRTMAALAVIANDDYWLRKTAGASEDRMRWQIDRFMGDLAWLEGVPVDWSYVLAIFDQSGLTPSLEDAPAKSLQKILAMLDTHIRRICKSLDMRPMDLPSRRKKQRNLVIHHGHQIQHAS